MIFEKGHIYHIYDQVNNRRKIFFNRENYLFFLKKIRKHILPYADIIAYCLMPNHFHLMIKVKDEGVITGGTTLSRAPSTNKPDPLNKAIGILLASYTRAINKQENRSGFLFRKRTKVECLTVANGVEPSFFNTNSGVKINIQFPEQQYPAICFDYIHQNPVKAGLTKKEIDWEFSSARDYAGAREGTLISKKIILDYIGENEIEGFANIERH